jgi:probable F420-dependent oxidoreductase
MKSVLDCTEALGFESFWCAEHPIMPVHSTSPHPGTPDGSIPESYAHHVDPFVALARASGVTTTIKLGTGITLVPERNPLLLAKEVATLDLFSGGRFLFGIGAGWHREETQIMGGDFDHRWTQAREAIGVMKALWTQEEAEFHGQYYHFPPVKSYPKPLQKPYPPVLLGGWHPRVLQRVASWGDGWLPGRITPAAVETGRAQPDALARQAGRDPDALTITVHGLVRGQAPEREICHRYHDAGATRVIIRSPRASTEQEMAEILERIAEAVIR